MTKIHLSIHPSIRIEGIPHVFEGDFHGVKLMDAIIALLDPYPKIKELCIKDNNRKPGIFYISQGAELASLGMLDIMLGVNDEEIEIKIVPILHGG